MYNESEMNCVVFCILSLGPEEGDQRLLSVGKGCLVGIKIVSDRMQLLFASLWTILRGRNNRTLEAADKSSIEITSVFFFFFSS